MISVIVPYAEDNTYLTRCINSVMRQNYKDIEILVITIPDDLSDELKDRNDITFIKKEGDSPYAGVNEALQKANGDYIFFCDVTSVPSPDTFSALLECADNNQEILFGGGLYLPSDNGFDISSLTSMSWLGKLFRKEVLAENHIFVKEDSALPELLFFVENLVHYEEYEENSDIFIYEEPVLFSEKKWNELDESTDWDTLFITISQLPLPVLTKMLQELTQYIQAHHIMSEDLLWAAEKNLHDCYGLNYTAAEPLLKSWWSAIKNDKDAKALQQLRQYLQQYDKEEDFFELLLNIIGLNSRQYPFLSYENPNDTMLLLIQNAYKDTGKELSPDDALTPTQKNFNELRKDVASLQININSNISGLEKRLYESMQKSNKAILDGEEDSHILELEDHIIKECQEGRVGLRTIMKFFKGWAAFKFNRGNRGQKNG